MSFFKKMKPTSRKLIVLMVTVILYVANDLAGGLLTEPAMNGIMGVIIAWIVGQGIADHGAQGKANAIKRMNDDTQEMRDLLQAVLGNGTPIAQRLATVGRDPVVSDSSKVSKGIVSPSWDDTVEVDEVDKKMLLEG